MIDCSDFIAEIGNYLDDDVAAEVRLQLEKHLSHCRTCQVIYDSARKTLQVVTESGAFDLSHAAAAPITQKVLARIRGTETDKP